MQKSKPDDETLVACVAQQDKAAFEALYDRYAQVVFTLAAHTLGTTDAEEVVQDVFMRLWERASQFNGARGSFTAWFMTIARNRVKDSLRKRSQHERFIAADEIYHMLANWTDGSPRTVEDTTIQREQKTQILQALHHLPAEQQRVIILAYFGELSQAALAEELQWPLGTVKKRIRLGMQKLRHFFINQEVEAEQTRSGQQ